MRLLCLLFLVVVVLAIVGFVMQNHQDVTLTFYEWGRMTAPLAAVVGVGYGLGMLTGWSVLGLLRRSFEAATDFRGQEPAKSR
jgi:uncharacterized integral membrane protein